MFGKTLWTQAVLRNSGLAFEMKKGQSVRISAPCVVDFVAFTSVNLRERFDQARTKANQRKLFLSVGDVLISKLNNTLLTIVEDTYTEGRHDLQSGGCSGKRFELLRQKGDAELAATYGRPIRAEEIPDHGCWENLSRAVAPWGIAPEDVPSPFNIFQDMHLDGKTGAMEHSPVRPTRPDTYVTLRAETDVLAALSVCPDFIAVRPGGGTIMLMDKAG